MDSTRPTPPAPSASRPARGRTLAAPAIGLAAGGALVAALLAGPGGGHLAGGLEAASAASTTALGRVATVLPLGYAFAAGMAAAVNPCGFALLPAYLGLYLGDGDAAGETGRAPARLRRAAAVSAVVSASFVALFGAAGLAVGLAAAVAGLFPWLGLLVGALLVVAGGRLLDGEAFHGGVAPGLVGRLGARARRPGAPGYLAYGLAYGLASLGCALPLFLAVAGSALAARGVLAALGQFVLYGLGMGAVLTALTLGVAAGGDAALRGGRRARRYVQPVGAVLVLLAGAYLIYYWLTLGGLLAGVGLP
ncbi:MAG TPA: cytochrome c biogenesis protein CcdA [Thermomicrobiales bacterium]|nr:cytochrome c biogenesis protein CcdA [Thermomicrobiales bacterium]